MARFMGRECGPLLLCAWGDVVRFDVSTRRECDPLCCVHVWSAFAVFMGRCCGPVLLFSWGDAMVRFCCFHGEMPWSAFAAEMLWSILMLLVETLWSGLLFSWGAAWSALAAFLRRRCGPVCCFDEQSVVGFAVFMWEKSGLICSFHGERAWSALLFPWGKRAVWFAVSMGKESGLICHLSLNGMRSALLF